MRLGQEFKTFVLVGLLTALLAVSTPGAYGQTKKPEAEKAAAPSIKITLIPPKGEGERSWGDIGGSVGGVDVKDCGCRVVIYAHTDKWYVQPFANKPFTAIGETGTWKSGIHLGWDYAALLVKSSFKPDSTTDMLPEIGGDVLAVDTVPAKEP